MEFIIIFYNLFSYSKHLLINCKYLRRLKEAIKKYIHFYNHKRLQAKLKGLTPIDYRAQALIFLLHRKVHFHLRIIFILNIMYTRAYGKMIQSRLRHSGLTAPIRLQVTL